MSILVVIADGIFSHAYADQDVYVVDLDRESSNDPATGSLYYPELDYSDNINVEDINEIFGTEFGSD